MVSSSLSGGVRQEPVGSAVARVQASISIPLGPVLGALPRTRM
jgi:hypothetical protein